MDKLKEISTDDLLKEILTRQGIRSITILENEFHRIQVSGERDSKLRYLKGNGPGMILEFSAKDV